jgi:DNA-binding transcriptional regulator YiaG
MSETRLGQELISGMKEAVEHARGVKKLRMSSMDIPQPAREWRKDQIAYLRKRRFGVSQPVFASLLSVTASTVRAWEQGLKSPSGAARRLLELADMAPEIFRRLAHVHSGAHSHA